MDFRGNAQTQKKIRAQMETFGDYCARKFRALPTKKMLHTFLDNNVN